MHIKNSKDNKAPAPVSKFLVIGIMRMYKRKNTHRPCLYLHPHLRLTNKNTNKTETNVAPFPFFFFFMFFRFYVPWYMPGFVFPNG